MQLILNVQRDQAIRPWCVCSSNLERPDQDPQLDAFSMVLSSAYLGIFADVWDKWTARFWGSGQWHCSKCCQSIILVTFRCKMGLRWAGLAEAKTKRARGVCGDTWCAIFRSCYRRIYSCIVYIVFMVLQFRCWNMLKLPLLFRGEFCLLNLHDLAISLWGLEHKSQTRFGSYFCSATYSTIPMILLL